MNNVGRAEGYRRLREVSQPLQLHDRMDRSWGFCWLRRREAVDENEPQTTGGERELRGEQSGKVTRWVANLKRITSQHRGWLNNLDRKVCKVRVGMLAVDTVMIKGCGSWWKDSETQGGGKKDEKDRIDINHFYVTKLLYYAHNAATPKKSSYIHNFQSYQHSSSEGHN